MVEKNELFYIVIIIYNDQDNKFKTNLRLRRQWWANVSMIYMKIRVFPTKHYYRLRVTSAKLGLNN